VEAVAGELFLGDTAIAFFSRIVFSQPSKEFGALRGLALFIFAMARGEIRFGRASNWPRGGDLTSPGPDTGLTP